MRVYVVHDEQGEITSVVMPEPGLASELKFDSPTGTVIEVSTNEVEDPEPILQAVTPADAMIAIHTSYRVDPTGKLVRR